MKIENAHLKFEILWSRSKTGIDMKVSGLYRESVKSLPLMRWKTIFLRRKFYKKNPPVSLDTFSDAVFLY